jgi:hypothetical protein
MERHSQVFAFLAALTSGAFCLGKEEAVSPVSLLIQARKLQDVWSGGTPAVKMRTEIEVVDVKGKTTSGQYLVTWISPSRWREELEIGDYKRFASTGRTFCGKGLFPQPVRPRPTQ